LPFALEQSANSGAGSAAVRECGSPDHEEHCMNVRYPTILILIAAATWVAAAAPVGPVEEIRALENARNDAIVRGDSGALARMTSDDYTFITLRGELRTKEEIVKGFASGSFKYDSREISDLNIRVYGNTAVVTGRSNQRGSEDGQDYSGDYRFTRVYIKDAGRWQTVALQATRIER
jgi:ketosteroid isomerase-like protein